LNASTGCGAALEALAAKLGRDQWVTVLTVRGPGHTPRLHIINRSVPDLASDVYAEADWYWWPHAERIARTADPATAAGIMAQALSPSADTPEPPHGQRSQAHRTSPDTSQSARR
jgi:hypothetical protein